MTNTLLCASFISLAFSGATCLVNNEFENPSAYELIAVAMSETQEDEKAPPSSEPTGDRQKEDKPDLEPGTTIYFDFPELGKTSKGKDTRAGLYLPKNYSADKEFPLLVTFGGGSGTPDPKRAVKITNGQDFICLGVPYRAESAENSGLWQTNWEYYQAMFEKVESVVPNIDPRRRACTGFSSGGAAILYQIGASEGKFQEYFHAFMPCGAGWPMGGLDSIEGRPMLAVMGENDKRLPNFRTLEKDATEAGVDFQLRVIPNAGHKIPGDEFPAMKDWLVEKLDLADDEE